MMNEELARQFHISQVDPAELCDVLLSYFSQGTYSGPRTQRYYKQEGGPYLDVTFSRGGRVLDIVESGLTPDELIKISSVIKIKLVDNQTTKIGRTIAFASRPIEGYVRCKNFQILPAPVECPRPPVAAAKWPFILEFQYRTSNDAFLSIHRKQRRALELSRQLNLFLNTSITARSNRTPYSEHAWVVNDSDPQHRYSEWKYLDYFPAGTVDLQDQNGFSTPGCSAMDSTVSLQYFADMRSGGATPLDVPQDLCGFFSTMDALAPELNATFLRAITWNALAEDIWLDSRSASYNAFVSAIECLMPTEPQTCATCGQPVYDLTKRFKEFLREFAPSTDQPAMDQLINSFYGFRSEITHGATLHESDLMPLSAGNPRNADHSGLHRELGRTVRVALLNWLIKQTGPSDRTE